jgi:geranylgeranyl diphosphate synthase type II
MRKLPKKLKFFYQNKFSENNTKIEEVKRIFEINDIPLLISQEIRTFTDKAFDNLDKMNITKENKDKLRSFGTWLMNRTV